MEEFITNLVGVPQNSWQKNADLNYLYNCAAEFRLNRSKYAEKILDLVRPRIQNSAELDKLLAIIQHLVDQATSQAGLEFDIYISQAMEIVANDFWLLGEMSKQGAPPNAIFLLKQNIGSEAIDVGKRLLNNAKRKVQALSLPKVELDESRIQPLNKLKLDSDVSPVAQFLNDARRIHLIINAGRSTRLRTTIPKGVLYLGGKPLIQHTIDAGRKAGFDATIVVLGFKKEINALFLDKNIQIVTQATIEGTAHAVMCAYPVLKNFKGTLLISYSDMPFMQPETLHNLLEKHETSRPVMSILTTRSENNPEFGRLVRDGRGYYLRIAQARIEQTDTEQADAGFYCFQSPEFWSYLVGIENRNNRYEYYLTDILNKISSAGKAIVGYETNDKIETLGINRPHEFIKAFEIDCFLRRRYSHDQLLEYDRQQPPEFQKQLVDCYRQFQIFAPDRLEHPANHDIDLIEKARKQQIGAIFCV